MLTAAIDWATTIGVVPTVTAVLALAMLVRATIGFGDALLAMPILALLVGVRSAAPLVTALSLTVAALILGRGGRTVVTSETLWLLGGAVPGVPVGALLLRALPEAMLASMLGTTVCLYGVWRIVMLSRTGGPGRSARSSTTNASGHGAHRLAPVAGFAAGAFGAATGAGGPPVVMYGVARGWSPPRFRAALQMYFLCAGALAMCAYVAAGLWTATSTRLYVSSLPGVLVAVVIGSRLADRVPAAQFARLVAVALVALGSSLLVLSIR